MELDVLMQSVGCYESLTVMAFYQRFYSLSLPTRLYAGATSEPPHWCYRTDIVSKTRGRIWSQNVHYPSAKVPLGATPPWDLPARPSRGTRARIANETVPLLHRGHPTIKRFLD